MTLGEKRKLFTKLICEHVLWLIAEGFEVTFDEGLDRLTAKDPTSDHMKNSLHGIGLGQDLNLLWGVAHDNRVTPAVRGEVGIKA